MVTEANSGQGQTEAHSVRDQSTQGQAEAHAIWAQSISISELKWRKIFELLEFRRQQPHPLRYLIFHITSLTWGYSPCSDALMNVMATYLGIAPNKSLTTRNCRPRFGKGWQEQDRQRQNSQQRDRGGPGAGCRQIGQKDPGASCRQEKPGRPGRKLQTEGARPGQTQAAGKCEVARTEPRKDGEGPP